MDVQRETLLLGVTGQVLEPGTGTCPDGVGGDADANTALAQGLELAQVFGHALLTESLDPTACISRVEQDKGNAGLLGGFSGGERLLEPQVVELADRRVAGAEELPIDVDVVLADLSGCQA